MILIKKATVNDKIALSLAENTTISSPFYLFEFEADQLRTKFYVIGTQTVATSRADIFTIEEGVDDPVNGQLILGNVGFYTYNIYAQSSSTNLDPTLSDEKVETNGKMKFIDGETSQYIQHDPTVTFVAHEPAQ